MPNTPLAAAGYKRLVSEIASLYEGARKALVEAYWKIGQRIVLVEQQGAIKAAYGTGLLQKLSGDLTKQCGPGFSERNLERMRTFYLDHPKSSAPTKLTWTHYVELMSLKDVKRRGHFEKQALQEEWTSKDIRELVRHELVREEVAEKISGNGERETEPQELLTPIRGTLWTYRIIKPKLVGTGESELLIDLGFSCTKDLDNITGKNYSPDTIVQSSKDPEGSYKLSAISSGLDSLYTYVAEVERIVDGDTLKVVVDLGFGFKTRQYLRLRGLDCPEIDTPEGKKAAEFVRSRIRVASEIVLTSSKSDKYDRYLADVFFTDSKGQEIFLNNLLLQEGLAVKVSS